MLTMQVAPSGDSYRSPENLLGYWDRVRERIAAIPGVQQVALTDALPMSPGFSITSFNVSGRPELPPDQQRLTHYVNVSPAYFTTLGIPVLSGREFDARDVTTNPNVIVINEAMARREFTGQDPIGQKFSFGPDESGQEQWLEIVGVVGNARQYRADQDPVPMTYSVYSSSPQRAMNVLVRTAGEPATVATAVRAALQALDPALPVSRTRTLDEVVGASLTQRKFNMTLLMVFAGIAVVLSIAGIYGTVAYAVAQRTQEIGIRVALGATGREILGLMLMDALKPVAAGLIVGLLGAFALSTFLERLVYGISTTDPLTFVALPLLLAAVAFVASWIPAARAARVDPMVALRAD
jgi:predicted permease